MIIWCAGNTGPCSCQILPPGTRGQRPFVVDFLRAHERQSMEHPLVPLRVACAQKPLGVGGDGSVCSPYHQIRRLPRRCQWCGPVADFNRAIQSQTAPKYLSSDHDPLYLFHRWRANLRVLDITEVKTLPYVPLSHPFIERLIGTIRREFLDHTLFWNSLDLERKLGEFQYYYNQERVHASLGGDTPAEVAGESRTSRVKIDDFPWRSHCRGLVHLPRAA